MPHQVIRISGVDSGYPVQVQDINNNYRLETEQGVTLLRNGRPSYRSIPARRGEGSRSSKLDYFLYSTRTNGFTEWLIDRNDLEADGAAAFFASSSYLPQHMNADWGVWRERPTPSWGGARLTIECQDDELASSQTSAASAALSGRAHLLRHVMISLAGVALWRHGFRSEL